VAKLGIILRQEQAAAAVEVLIIIRLVRLGHPLKEVLGATV
jgi:hypothetical protein